MRSSDHEAEGQWRGRLRDGITPVQVDEELLLLDREAGSLVRLDGDATRALASGDAAVSAALDSLGVTPTAGPGRREVLASGALAVLGITVMALPTAAVAVSPGPTGVTAAGTTDIEFNPALGAVEDSASVFAVAPQPDGKILLGGAFNTVNDIERVNLARLNQDGTLDTSFTPPAIAVGGSVRALGLQSNGSVIVGALSNDQDTLLRLHPNGVRDDSLPAAIPSDVGRRVMSVLVLPDDRFLVGGAFDALRIGNEDVPRRNIARFNANGTLDEVLNPNVDGVVQAIAVDRDGRIVIGGSFGRVDPSGSEFNRRRIARLHADGTLDVDFNPSSSGIITSLLIQPNSPGQPETIVAGGSFVSVGGTDTRRLVRLDDSGAVIQAYDPGFDSTVESLTRQSDGSVVVGGRFTTFNGDPLTSIARLSPSGAIDADFNVSINSWVHAIALQADGRIVLGGRFTEVGGESRLAVARLT